MRKFKRMVCDHGVSKHLACEQCSTPPEKSETSPQENDSDFSQGTQINLIEALDLTSTHERDCDFYHDYCATAMQLESVDEAQRVSSCSHCGLVVYSSRSTVEVWNANAEEN